MNTSLETTDIFRGAFFMCMGSMIHVVSSAFNHWDMCLNCTDALCFKEGAPGVYEPFSSAVEPLGDDDIYPGA